MVSTPPVSVSAMNPRVSAAEFFRGPEPKRKVAVMHVRDGVLLDDEVQGAVHVAGVDGVVLGDASMPRRCRCCGRRAPVRPSGC